MPGSPQLRRMLDEARERTDRLFEIVCPNSLYERPIPERNRIIFYVGHLEAFDWNQIGRGSVGLSSDTLEFDQLFSFGIDPKEGTLPDDRPEDWPSISQVHDYNRKVRSRLDEVLGEASEQILHVALEHRLMHAETLAYMLHNLPFDLKIPPELEAVEAGPAPAGRMIEIPEGAALLGRTQSEGFGWDNEFEAHLVYVPRFKISKYKTTNAEYLEFVRQGADAPHFWTRRGDEWLLRTMFGEIPLPTDWPVYVTYREATAYAAWKDKSLLSEAQFHRAAHGISEGSRGNFDFRRWDPIGVAQTPDGDSASGVSQLVGNGWEWTSTVFQPFPGFRPFPFYPGYSADFFDNDHYVVKGGSPQTAACMLRRSFRNWFRPGYPYTYTGFRCVEN